MGVVLVAFGSMLRAGALRLQVPAGQQLWGRPYGRLAGVSCLPQSVADLHQLASLKHIIAWTPPVHYGACVVAEHCACTILPAVAVAASSAVHAGLTLQTHGVSACTGALLCFSSIWTNMPFWSISVSLIAISASGSGQTQHRSSRCHADQQLSCHCPADPHRCRLVPSRSKLLQI